jgi:hypothetical protein
MEAAQPELAALAKLAGLTLYGLTLGLILLIFIDARAPSQDLPWEPLRISDPLGMATGGKIARAAGDPQLCRRVLVEGGVRFSEAEARSSDFCSTANSVRITGGVTALSPAAPVMTCPAALAFAIWDRQVVQPAADVLMSSPAARIDHFGTYACRRVYGGEGGRVSEHATANAFDFAGVRLADGRRITVASDFQGGAEEGVFMRVLRAGGCEVFHTVLGPDYNEAHADHLHLDMGRFSICR